MESIITCKWKKKLRKTKHQQKKKWPIKPESQNKKRKKVRKKHYVHIFKILTNYCQYNYTKKHFDIISFLLFS